MTAIDTIIEPPDQVRRRAWECAWDIADDRSLDPELRTRAYNRAAAGWGDITWDECREWFRRHREIWPARK